MRILQLSTADILGGAEKVAWNLHHAYAQRGHSSVLAVGFKHSDGPGVIEIPRSRVPQAGPGSFAETKAPTWRRIARVPPVRYFVRRLRLIRRDAEQWVVDTERRMGRENFDYPGSHTVLRLSSPVPQVVHAHNLHGYYFDLRVLTELSQSVPVVLTLHDEWMLTGHCAYTFGCTRWQIGCGHCPDLTIYPAVEGDATAWNWRRKRGIYKKCRLYVSTPSEWLRDRVRLSMMRNHETRVIPYGVDLQVFRPHGMQEARSELGLPLDSHILLFASNRARHNPFKDFSTITESVELFAANRSGERPVILVALGSDDEDERVGSVLIRHVPFQADSLRVSRYYQAADVVLHAAKADNFPNTILEALACGKPVVASSVGGIPEQIEDGLTGYLVPPSDPQGMSTLISRLLENKELREDMGRRAAEVARSRFDLNLQADRYLAWYQEIIADWAKPRSD